MKYPTLVKITDLSVVVCRKVFSIIVQPFVKLKFYYSALKLVLFTRKITTSIKVSHYDRLADNTVGPLDFRALYSEILELCVALFQLDLKNIKAETFDVLAVISIALRRKKLPIPILGIPSRNKYADRAKRITLILDGLGLKFSPRFLVGGSNIDKPEKLKRIILMAELDQRGLT